MSLFSLLRCALPGVLGVSLLVPAQVLAQDGFLFDEPRVTLSVRGGHHMASAGSDLYDEFFELLTLERGDFSGFTVMGDLGVRLTSNLDLVGSIGWIDTEAGSESRTHIGFDDEPIAQTTSLRRMPVAATLKYYPLDRGRSISSHAWIPAHFTPYVGVGVGTTKYQLQQEGEFVNYATCDEDNACEISELVLDSDGWGRTLHLAGGADYWLTTRFGVTADVRYQWGSAELSSSYQGFEDIDLGGLQGTVGLSVRF
ncbi:MAG TPA: hypothetical protein VFU06_06155 [Longimicrobiales bacterium]|nr:hypothetical protein [Longimicrobiales bacterium]